MKIQSEIRDYILSHDFVMLPGIGAFVAEYSKPYFDMNGEIIPGDRKIRFNPLLRNDSDVEVLQVFKERMNITDREVQEQYFAFLDTVNEQIRTFNRYYWDGFGIILREGPDEAFQFLPFQPAAEQATAIIAEPAAVPEVVQEDVSIPPLEEEEAGEEEPAANKAVKYLVFALPLALLSAALAYMVFFKPSLRDTVKEAPLREYDLGEVTVDTLFSEETIIPPVINEKPQEEHIVRVGIYKREKDAGKIVAFLEKKGYSAKIRPHGPLFKVYLVAYTEEQAERYIKEVAKLIDDTPIYERKNNDG